MPSLITRIARAIRGFGRARRNPPPTAREPDAVKDAATIRRVLRARLPARLLKDIGGGED